MINKIYTAFISSSFKDLKKERETAINCILDHLILPIGMEHFTISTSGKFSDIEKLIDVSDFFILLMGTSYGDCDENGVSWTEREYNYAQNNNKPMIVIATEKLDLLKNVDTNEITLEQRKQLDFYNNISFARVASEDFGIDRIISSFFSTYDFSKCNGWERIDCSEDDEYFVEWRDKNKVFDIGGIWYHAHLSDSDLDYIRIGTITIKQDFTPKNYLNLKMEGINYDVLYCNIEKIELQENEMRFSRFSGDYKMQEDGGILGVFRSRRTFKGDFSGLDVKEGTIRGIHDFHFDTSASYTRKIDGEFHDEAPSPKMGRLFLFRNVSERNSFVIKNRRNQLIRLCKEK